MIGRWIRARRARVAANRRAAAESRAELERIRAQWPTVHAHAAEARRQASVDHVGEAVLAMIHRRHP